MLNCFSQRTLIRSQVNEVTVKGILAMASGAEKEIGDQEMFARQGKAETITGRA
jgi:hypothetical protein